MYSFNLEVIDSIAALTFFLVDLDLILADCEASFLRYDWTSYEACNDIKVKVGNDSPFGLEVSCESLNETVIIPHDVNLLRERLKEQGLDPEGFNHYLDPFRYGMPPHAS